MFRVLSSWRLLGVALVVVAVVLAASVWTLERAGRDRTLDEVKAQAQLVNELLLGVNLPARRSDTGQLDPATVNRLRTGLQLLVDNGRVVGLQLWTADGVLLFSGSGEAVPLSAEEDALVGPALAGEPQVSLEAGADRSVPTATVLLQAQDRDGVTGDLVVQIMVPQRDVTAALAAARWRIYGSAAVLLLVVVGAGLALRARLLRREHEALHDPLTGLGNRSMLAAAATSLLHERAGRDGAPRPAALLLLDLDGFKTVNDTLGHAVGDRLLVAVAATLRAMVRPDDVVVRLGGDEFAVLVRHLPGEAAALRIATSVSDALHRPFEVDRVTLEVGVSLGVAMYPEQGTTLDLLMRRADVAMYQAKRESGRVQLYDPSTDPHDEQELNLLSQLRRAVEEDQLVLHYQPKVSVPDGRAVGFEALVRWQHPQHGLLPPSAFVPLAERTGLIRPLTTWVLRTALARCAAWRAAGWDCDVAVNIAPSTLLEASFATQLTQLLADADLPGAALQLEITETAVMVDPLGAVETLRRLRVMGVTVSIDDFGAGYTSLAYLTQLPVRTLKIDRGFITHLLDNPKDEAVARSMVTLGHDLGMTVVAEGVETEGVRARLAELGCDEVQGYLLARPMPQADIDAWLRDHGGHRAEAVTVPPARPCDRPSAGSRFPVVRPREGGRPDPADAAPAAGADGQTVPRPAPTSAPEPSWPAASTSSSPRPTARRT